MLDKKALLAKRDVKEREVELPSMGGSVKVRSLTRAEALRVTGKPMDADEMECKLISMALIDPEMTEDEVRQWQEVAPAGELQPIALAVQELSGMQQTVVKEGMQRFR